MDYTFLQHYWCFIIALLAAILVFLMFVQGANSQIFQLGKSTEERRIVINSTGRKWEYTFTTLVTFGGAFFAAYPLFYSTSFGGAYWLWTLILISFVIQAVSYEFQNKQGNKLGARTFQIALVINGYIGPFLLGVAVATFFTGANFIVERDNIYNLANPVVSKWANGSHGLDALFNIWNIVFGLAVVFLSRILGNLYTLNNIEDYEISMRNKKMLIINDICFYPLFIAFIFHVLTKDGLSFDIKTGEIYTESQKYLHNLFQNPVILVVFLVGVALVLLGSLFPLKVTRADGTPCIRGIWPASIGTIFVVTTLLLCAAWFNTAYYPSNIDPSYSLTMQNSCSSEFTLRTMFYVSLLIPFVLLYIVKAWRSMDKKKLTREEIQGEEHLY